VQIAVFNVPLSHIKC